MPGMLTLAHYGLRFAGAASFCRLLHIGSYFSLGVSTRARSDIFEKRIFSGIPNDRGELRASSIRLLSFFRSSKFRDFLTTQVHVLSPMNQALTVCGLF